MCKHRVVTDFAQEQIGWTGFYVIHTDEGCLFWDKEVFEDSDTEAVGFPCSQMKRLGSTLKEAFEHLDLIGHIERVIWCEKRSDVAKVYDEILVNS